MKKVAFYLLSGGVMFFCLKEKYQDFAFGTSGEVSIPKLLVEGAIKFH